MLAAILAAVLTFTMPADVAEPVTLRSLGADRAGHVIVRGTPDHDDTLVIELPVAATRIDYDGGAGGFDALEIRGGAAEAQRYTQLNPHDGIIEIDGLIIHYTNLEPITDTAPAASFTINGTAGTDSVSVSEGPIGSNTTRVSAATFESVTFANKTNVVYDGIAGGDPVSIGNPFPATGLMSFLFTNVGVVSQSALIRYPFIGVSASGNVTLNFPTNEIDNVEVESSGGDVRVNSSHNLTIGNVSPALAGLSGIAVSATAPSVTLPAGGVVASSGLSAVLSATTGTVTVDGTVTGGTDVVLASNGTGVVVNGSVSASGDVYLQTSRLLIGPTATIAAPAGTVAVQTRSFAPNIDLGSTTDASGTGLELSDAELDRIAAPTVILETFNVGSITVSQPITFPAHLILISPGFTATGSGSLSAPTLSFVNTVIGARTWTITPSTVQLSGGAPVPYTATTLNVSSVPTCCDPGAGNDTFFVTPSATTTINVDGNGPAPPQLPGDTLDFDLTGVISPVLTVTLGPNGYSGSLTSANRQPVNFEDIETLVDVPVDLGITKTGSPTAVAGGPISYTIVVSNPGPLAVSNATVTDSFPSELSGISWTCTASAGSNCAAGGTGAILQSVTLAAGGSVTFNVSATITASTTTNVSNTATVTPPAGSPETNGADNTSTFTTAVTAQAAPASIPTLSVWMLMLLAVALAIVALKR